MSGNFDHPYLLGGLVVLNWPLYVALARWIVGDSGELHDAAHFFLIPDIFFLGSDLDQGELNWSAAKFMCWLLLCVAFVVGEYAVLGRVVDWMLT